MVSPSRIAIQEDSSNKQNSTSRNTQGKCSKCGRCGTSTGVRKGQLIYTTAMLCWKWIGLGVQARDQFIKQGKLLTADVRTLYTW